MQEQEQELQVCPFPGCFGDCKATEYEDGSWRVGCLQILSCDYFGPRCRTEVEAAAAHNSHALAVRLFPRACELLRGVDDRGRYPEESLEAWGRSVAYDEWTDQRDALLTEAQGVADAE